MQGRKSQAWKSQKPRSNTGPGVVSGFNIAVKDSKYEVVTLSVAKQDSKVGLEAISWLRQASRSKGSLKSRMHDCTPYLAAGRQQFYVPAPLPTRRG